MKTVKFTLPALIILTIFACKNKKEMKNENPFFGEYKTPHQTAPFDQIKEEHYMPAFKEGIKRAKASVDKIVNSKDKPTFENTIVALERSGELLGKVASVFYNLTSAETNDKLQAIAKEVSPLMSEYSNDINLNAGLFKKVKAVYDDKDNHKYTPEQLTLLTDTYKGFVRSGANLNDADKAKLREISKKLSKLTLEFGDNVLGETNAYQLHVTIEADLKGLPESFKEAAALTAKQEKKEGWIFTLQYPSFGPFLRYVENRKLREELYKAYATRCSKGKFDNSEILKNIANLRLAKSKLLGYKSYADYVLEERMAKSADKVNTFLNKLYEASMPFAKNDVKRS